MQRQDAARPGGGPAAPGGSGAGEARRALLSWWMLAGVDQPVARTPRSWVRPPPAHAPIRAPREGVPAFETLGGLRAHVAAGGRLVPLADGNPESGFVIVGEGPSAEDMRTGRPFSGRAGVLLDRMLAAIGRDRTSAYVTLLAPRARVVGTLSPHDLAADLPLTLAHLALLRPRLLLLLGGLPAGTLAGSKEPISALRGRPLTVVANGVAIRALPTFNPAFLLRRPEAKALAWADLLAAQRMLRE
jgi:DNA polymerase